MQVTGEGCCNKLRVLQSPLLRRTHKSMATIFSPSFLFPLSLYLSGLTYTAAAWSSRVLTCSAQRHSGCPARSLIMASSRFWCPHARLSRWQRGGGTSTWSFNSDELRMIVTGRRRKGIEKNWWLLSFI
jgi:hypothetical protein